MADLKRDHQRTGFETAVWIAKLVFLPIGIVSTAMLLASFVAPYLLRHLSSSLPRLRNSILNWFVPSYLFITVQFIIVIIWKLQGNQRLEDDTSPEAPSPIKPADLGSSPLAALDWKPSSDIGREVPIPPAVPEEKPPESDSRTSAESPILKSCLATDFDDKSSVSSHADINKSIEQRPWPPPEREEVEKGEPSSGLADGNDTMDAMWKTIMDGGAARPILKKSETFRETTPGLARAKAAVRGELNKSETFREVARAEAVGWRRREALVMGQDELFKRVESFIKMNYDQMRIQRQEYGAAVR